MKTTKQILSGAVLLLALGAAAQTDNSVYGPNDSTKASKNILIGGSAGFSIADGMTPSPDENIYIGNSAGQYAWGTNNVMIGHRSGLGSHFGSWFGGGGSRNVFLGNGAGQNNNYLLIDDQLVIHNSNVGDPLIYGLFTPTDPRLTLNAEVRINGYGAAPNSGLTFADLTNADDKRYLTVDGTGKVKLGAESAWTLGGNNVGASSFLGTLNLVDLVFKSRGARAGAIGTSNTALGTDALLTNNNIGDANVAVGAQSLKNVMHTSGDYNTAVGYQSGYSSLTGRGNTFIGNQTGYNNTGYANVFLGNNAGYNETGSNKLYISNSNNMSLVGGGTLIYGEFDKRIIKFHVDGSIVSPVVNTPTHVEIIGKPTKSGLRFNQLTNLTSGIPFNASNKFLTVNDDGDVVLESIGINPSDINIYEDDGYLRANRTVSLNGKNLIFSTVAQGEAAAGGKVIIGDVSNTTTPYDFKLYVEKGILTEKVKVALKGGSDWADYVFADDYTLMPLNDVESFIKTNKHLPGIESAEELQKAGLDLADMQRKQMEKIEELTLHLIEQNKIIEKQSQEIEVLKEQVKALLSK